MHMGICLWSFTDCHREAGRGLNPLDPFDLVTLAVRAGLTAVECGPAQFAGMSANRMADFRTLLNEQRLDLFLDTGSDRYAQDVTPLRDAIRLGHDLGARLVRTTISGVLEGDRRTFGLEGWQRHLQDQVKPLAEVMELATVHDLPVGVENHQDACSEELVWLCAQVDSPLLGITMDVANALAVGETPESFAETVMPYLRHVHLKDYTVHATPSGYRFKRCALGDGVVNWPVVIRQLGEGAPEVSGCIELGATQARHVRILEEDYWATYPPRPLRETIRAIRSLHEKARPPEEDWRTPHERGESAAARSAYEMDQFHRSARYIREELA